MIDPLTEALIDLKAACRLAPFRGRDGRPCHIASMYRMLLRGAKGHDGQRVKLEVIRVPSGQRTSLEAVTRFVAALSGADAPPANNRTTRRRQADISRAEAELAASGI